MHAPHKSGFTLIELLVVIAIIGVLSAVVLASLNSARTKGSDTAVMSSLGNSRAQAALFYDLNDQRYVITPGSATDVCSSSASVSGVKGVYSHIKAAADAAGVPLSTSNSVQSSNSQAVCHSCLPGIGAGLCGGIHSGHWAASVPLRGSANYFCVDSRGFSGIHTNNLASGDSYCEQ